MKPQCPRCSGGDLYEIDQVSFEANDSSNGVIPFAFVAHYGPSGETGFFGDKYKRVSVRASARVCRSCGHADLFTKDIALLDELASKGVAGIKKL
jgi:hypothetical protein